MALVMTPIFTQTASGSSSTLIFNNIPQFYTDLKLLISSRVDTTGTPAYSYLQFNTDTSTNYSDTRAEGNGSSVNSGRNSNNGGAYYGVSGSTSYTASTFANSEIYLPNYTSSNFKQFVAESVLENNGTAGWLTLFAGLWRSTAAISRIVIQSGAGNWAAGSTFSLYGIIRNGA